MRSRVLIVPVFLLAVPVLANSPKDDEIAAALLKEKEAYVATVEKAKGEMLKAFDKHFESVKNNKTLKIDVQLALLEKIEAEKKAFDENDVPTANPALKVPLSEYRTAQKKAEAACKAAFEKAAKAYRDKNDLKAAAAMLEEAKEFLAKAPSASAASNAAVAILSAHSGKVYVPSGGNTSAGTGIVTADYVKGDQTQLWKVIPAADGYVYIENVKAGLVMAVNGKGNGTQAQLATKKADADGQLWKVLPLDIPGQKGAVKLQPKGNDRVLMLTQGSKDTGVRLILWDEKERNDTNGAVGFIPPQ